jgi:hypothetical protein
LGKKQGLHPDAGSILWSRVKPEKQVKEGKTRNLLFRRKLEEFLRFGPFFAYSGKIIPCSPKSAE